MQGRYLVGVHKTTIEDSYHHSLATEPLLVHFDAIQRLHLRLGSTIVVGIRLPLIQFLAERGAFALSDGIRGREYFQSLGDEGETL